MTYGIWHQDQMGMMMTSFPKDTSGQVDEVVLQGGNPQVLKLVYNPH